MWLIPQNPLVMSLIFQFAFGSESLFTEDQIHEGLVCTLREIALLVCVASTLNFSFKCSFSGNLHLWKSLNSKYWEKMGWKIVSKLNSTQVKGISMEKMIDSTEEDHFQMPSQGASLMLPGALFMGQNMRDRIINIRLIEITWLKGKLLWFKVRIMSEALGKKNPAVFPLQTISGFVHFYSTLVLPALNSWSYVDVITVDCVLQSCI